MSKDSVTARLVTAIGDAIVIGRFSPGERLVEADLQAHYAAGRSSVREALQQLQALGLVTIAANRGASVRRLSRTEVADLFAVRERLEGLAASLAAQRVGSGAVAAASQRELGRLVQRMESAIQSSDAVEYGQLNRALHGVLLEWSGNQELLRLVQQLSLPIFQQQFRGFLLPDNQRASHAQHLAIIEAVLAADARGADKAMQRHVRDGLAMVMRWPDASFAEEAGNRPAA